VLTRDELLALHDVNQSVNPAAEGQRAAEAQTSEIFDRRWRTERVEQDRRLLIRRDADKRAAATIDAAVLLVGAEARFD
jgi:hypothetical protein